MAKSLVPKTKTHEYDPYRCTGDNGNCYKRMELGTRFCKFCLHKAGKLPKASKMYDLGLWKNDKQKFESGTVDVKDELDISRMVLEKLIKSCQNETELLAASDRINNYLDRVSKTAAIKHKIDRATGQLLDRSTLMQFAENIVKAVNDIFSDHPDGVRKLALVVMTLCENLSTHDNVGDERDS